MTPGISNAFQRHLIVLTGPESTAKTTLGAELSKRLQLPLVPEYAREWLTQSSGLYTREDLEKFAKAQIRGAEESGVAKRHVLADTFLLNIVIWSDVRFAVVSGEIQALYTQHTPALYLLCEPDIPWVRDPLRENEDIRQNLFDRFQTEIIKSGVPFHVIAGSGDKRVLSAWKR